MIREGNAAVEGFICAGIFCLVRLKKRKAVGDPVPALQQLRPFLPERVVPQWEEMLCKVVGGPSNRAAKW